MERARLRFMRFLYVGTVHLEQNICCEASFSEVETSLNIINDLVPTSKKTAHLN